MTVAQQLILHLTSLRAAGVMFLPRSESTVNLSSAPAPVVTEQFRRCTTCKATAIVPFSPSTAQPCKCGGEMFLSPVSIADLRAVRERCSGALERLAEKCESAAGADGKVTATGAAAHMKKLALWMLSDA